MDLGQLTNLTSGILQSSAFGNITASAFGALFGAWGAQAVITRGQRRQAAVAEINNINAALNLCFSLCSRYANFKIEHALPVLKSIELVSAERDAIFEKNKSLKGQLPVPFNPTLDFRTMTSVNAPIELLERQVFEKISIQGRGLAAFNELASASRGLDHAIGFRELLIAEYKSRKLTSDAALDFYLGSAAPGGTDSRYPDSVNAINSFVDACIFFSKTLADNLTPYGNALRKKNAGWFMRSLPKVGTINWSPTLKSGLFQSEKIYENWVKSFGKQS